MNVLFTLLAAGLLWRSRGDAPSSLAGAVMSGNETAKGLLPSERNGLHSSAFWAPRARLMKDVSLQASWDRSKTLQDRPEAEPTQRPLIRVEIVLPVFNEEESLERSVRALHSYLTRVLSDDWRVTIADNGSRDGTPEIAATLSAELPGIRVLRHSEKGRGRALKLAWSQSDADVFCYMDIDLATDLEALPRMLGSIREGASVVIGNRFHPDTAIERGLLRTALSRGYNALARLFLATGIPDLQCGFKAISRPIRDQVLGLVDDTGWFFDTELLILTERLGHRIVGIPVRWREAARSSVKLGRTVLQMFWSLYSLKLALPGRIRRARGGRTRMVAPA